MMDKIVIAAKKEYITCKTTGDIRKLSAKLFGNIGDKSKDNIFSLCNELLEQREWALGVIAFDFAYRMKKQYDENTFAVFEGWLEKYVRGWGDCDDLCVHALGELVRQKPGLVLKMIAWTKRDEFWMRRASAVGLILSIRRDDYKKINPFQISDLLMKDGHYLVLKGYGWMLKELASKEPDRVFDYLMENKAVMPRVAFRYAMQKMDADKKRILMQ